MPDFSYLGRAPRAARMVEVQASGDSPNIGRAAYFHEVANRLRAIAAPFLDLRHKAQLLALADGFERYAVRLEQRDPAIARGRAMRAANAEDEQKWLDVADAIEADD